MTVSPTDTGWIDRVIEYLRLGSRGVMVLVDKAHDSHAGYLARAMLKELGQFHEARTAAELRDCPKNAAVLLRLRDPEEVVALNIGRQVVRDNELRVVVWGAPEVMEVLPRKAFDFFDWISHRVECPPRRAFRWMVQLLQAAEDAQRPIAWPDLGTVHELQHAAHEAWPEAPHLDVRVDDHADLIVAALGQNDSFVFLRTTQTGGAPPPIDMIRLRWMLAETGRRTRVAVCGVGWSPGFWLLSRSSDGAAISDCEPDVDIIPVADVRVFLGTGTPLALRSRWREAERFSNSSTSADIRAATLLDRGAQLQSWMDDNAARWVEAQLWMVHRTGLSDWVELGERATALGVFDLAERWFARVPAGKLRAGLRRVRQRLDLGDYEGAVAQFDQIELPPTPPVDLVGEVSRFRALIAAELRPLAFAPFPPRSSSDAVVLCYAHVVTGDWHAARAIFPGQSPRLETLQNLEREALAVAMVLLDATAHLGSHGNTRVDAAPRASKGSPRAVVLGLLVHRGVQPAASLTAAVEARAVLVRLSPGESFWLAIATMIEGQALARLGRRESARLTLLDAEGILERTTKNPKHPLILVARFERIWLDVVEKKAPAEDLDAVLAELESVLWPEHREVVAARALRRRV